MFGFCKKQVLFFVAVLSVPLLGVGCGQSEADLPISEAQPVPEIFQPVIEEDLPSLPPPAETSDENALPNPEDNPAQDEEREISADSKPAIKEFEIAAVQWEFIPAVITVHQGDTVRLHVISEDVEHGIGIPSYGVSTRLDPGKTETIEFVADKKGTFPMICTVFCGAEHGSMKASLIVQ